MSTGTLTDRELLLAETIAAIAAELVLERLASDHHASEASRPPAAVPRLVDAAELALVLRVTRGYIYRNSDPLGGRHIGDGPRPRLRFDLDQALAAFAALPAEPTPAPPPSRNRRRAPASTVPLLPIGGKLARARFTSSESHQSDRRVT